MAVSNVWQIAAINANIGSSLWVRSVTRSRVAMNLQTTREVTAGSVYPQASHTRSVKPLASFTTKDLTGLLTICGVNGVCVANPNTVLVYLVKRDCSGVASGSVHEAWTVLKGIIVPTTLSLRHQQDAELSADIYTASPSAGTSAISRALTVAAPSVTDQSQRWTLGGAWVAGTQLTSKTNVEINFGHKVFQESADGDLWDSFVGIKETMPTIRLTGMDPTWATTSGLTGSACTHANTRFFAKDRAQTDATAAHWRFTTAGSVYLDEGFGGSNTDPTETSLNLESLFDGTNSPIIGTALQAIA